MNYAFFTKTDKKVYAGLIILTILFVLLKHFVFVEKTIVIYAKAKPVVVALPSQPRREPTPKEVIEGVFGPKAKEALLVGFCESSLNPKAKHKLSSASGLFQIISPTWKRFKCVGDPFNSLDNATCAKLIYDHSGWFPWASSKACHKLI
jgi:hypothetical protein